MPPLAWERARRRGERYFDSQSKEKQHFGWLAKIGLGIGVPFEEPLEVELVFRMPIPASFSEKKTRELHGTFHRKCPDLDNLMKFVFDALNRVVWYDDKQIVNVTATKVYSRAPGTSLVVKPVEEDGYRSNLGEVC